MNGRMGFARAADQVETGAEFLRLAARSAEGRDTRILSPFRAARVFFGRRPDRLAGARSSPDRRPGGREYRVFLSSSSRPQHHAPRGTVERTPSNSASAPRTSNWTGRTMHFSSQLRPQQTRVPHRLRWLPRAWDGPARGRIDLHAASEGQQRHDGRMKTAAARHGDARTHVATDRLGEERGAWMRSSRRHRQPSRGRRHPRTPYAATIHLSVESRKLGDTIRGVRRRTERQTSAPYR